MADDDEDTQTQVAPAPAPAPSGLSGPVLDRLIQQLTTQQQAAMPTGTPDDGTRPSWTGLLGQVLSGGQGPGYKLRGGEADTSGNRALLNFGINMLLASGPHAVRPDVLSAAATGLQGAQESLGLDQQRAGAVAATAYEQNRQQQQDQLARIKEALPLLTLQQKMRAIQGLPTTIGGAPGVPGTGSNVATGGSIGMPPEYLPFYQEASARTGIPIDVLIAQGKEESGFNTNSPSGGIHQILKSTAKDPGFGLTGIDPATLKDPRTNINFAADYLAARAKAAGADFSSPQGITKALTAYNGGGDKDYASKVMALIPGARTALAPPPALGQTVPPPAPGKAPPPAANSPPGPRPVLPPPDAPIAPGAGGAQVAGPGGPTSGVIPPSPPGSGADVADIIKGMVGAGADPATLAPGPGSMPPGQAGAVAAGPGGPTAPAPGSYEEYRLLHPITPSADDLAGFRTTPDADQIANIRKQAANAQTSYAAARDNLDTAGMAKASDDYNTAIAKENELRQAAAKLGTDTRAKFMADQDKQRYDAWAKDVEDQRKQADAERAQQNALALEAARAEEARKTAAAASENSYVLDERKRFGLERDSARTNIDDLQMLKALSDAAGTSTPLENIQVGDKSGRDYMVQWGLGTQAAQQKWGAQQAFEAAVNKTVTGLRQGMSMGQLSDRDMAFIQHMAPSLLQSPQTRADIMAYLEQAQYRRLNYADAVEQLWDGGKGLSWGQAKREAQKQLPDYVPKVPGEYTGWDAPTRKAWLQSNARPGQLMRGPDGRLSIYQPQATP